MSSLQEQLLKAGLVDEKKLARAKQEKNRKAKQTRKQHGKQKPQPDNKRQQRQSRKTERDRELNQKRQQERQLKELAAQATQMIVDNKLERAAGEHPYGFVYKRKVKKMYVTEAQKKQLAAGQLAIATYVAADGRKFELVPQAIADKIGERDASFLVPLESTTEPGQDDKDAYAGYEVPDDLIW